MRPFAILFLFGLIPASAAQAETCALDFMVEITHGVGDIRPGRQMIGAAEYTTVGRSFRQEGGATAHLATGRMSLDGDIGGRIWTLINTSNGVAADLISVHARDVEGFSFAGVPFEGPMVLTLFGPSGTRDTAEPPLTQEGWDAMDLRRSFALYADGADRLAGTVRDLRVACR